MNATLINARLMERTFEKKEDRVKVQNKDKEINAVSTKKQDLLNQS